MIPDYAHSLGGKKMAPIIREKALLEYYKNPRICKSCSSIIYINDGQKPAEVKKKIFCNSKCAAIYNNDKREKKQKIKKVRTLVGKFNYLIGKTKREIFSKCKNWQSARTSIRRFAVYIYESSDKPKKCCKCGYDKHYEVCHIKSVSSFSEGSLVEEINNIDNLIALCPNCHWEFDNINSGVVEGVISPSS